MRLKLIIFLSFLFFAILIVFFYKSEMFQDRSNYKNDIFLSVEPEYKNYSFGQRVWLKVKLFNHTSSDYYLKESFDAYGIKFNISDPKNNKLFNGIIVHSMIIDSIKLEPENYFENIFPIDNYINNFNSVEGTYSIEANYQDLVSNSVKIKMSSPSGDTEDQYLVYKNLFNINSFSGADLETEKSMEFLKKYEESIYAPDIYDKVLIANLMAGNINQIESIVNRFFQNNSDTYASKFIIDHYFTFLTNNGFSEQEAIIKLNDIKSGHIGSKTEYIIETFLNKLAKK